MANIPWQRDAKIPKIALKQIYTSNNTFFKSPWVCKYFYKMMSLTWASIHFHYKCLTIFFSPYCLLSLTCIEPGTLLCSLWCVIIFMVYIALFGAEAAFFHVYPLLNMFKSMEFLSGVYKWQWMKHHLVNAEIFKEHGKINGSVPRGWHNLNESYGADYHKQAQRNLHDLSLITFAFQWQFILLSLAQHTEKIVCTVLHQVSLFSFTLT